MTKRIFTIEVGKDREEIQRMIVSLKKSMKKRNELPSKESKKLLDDFKNKFNILNKK